MTATTLTDRALIRLSGDDVRGFLQGLVTNDVLAALPVYAGLLTPQGKALFDFIVWADPDGGGDVLIDCEAQAADDLVRRLSLYRLRRAITIARDPALAVHWSADGETGVADPRSAVLGRRWIGPAGEADTDTSPAFRARRLASGIVEGRAELGSDALLWLEANAREQHGVSFTKGCYVGQENTARMHHRDKVRKRLSVVPLAEAGDAPRATYADLNLAVVLERLND